MKALLAKGAEIDLQAKDGSTALFMASQNGHEGIVQALVAKGAEIDHQVNNGFDKPKMVRPDYGVSGGARGDCASPGGQRSGDRPPSQKWFHSLDDSVQKGREGIVQALLAKGAEIDHQAKNGTTALLMASQKGHQGIVQTLLAKGAEIDLQAKNGATALYIASQKGHEGTVQALLAKGAEIDHQFKDGSTALYIASQKGHEGIVQALLTKGAKIDHQNKSGATALYMKTGYSVSEGARGDRASPLSQGSRDQPPSQQWWDSLGSSV